MLPDKELRRAYPEFNYPIYCENGCGAVIEMIGGFNSYKKRTNKRGEVVNLIICECCAAEEGRVHEADEAPDESPVCRRKPK